jgi:exodeoxyribonuclease VII large subunit
VIRDILHRVAERWPCRVVVWPVVVQGDAAAGQVCAAIEGFGRMAPGGPIARPDLIIVARGGGSVEDLWPFNDEQLARTVAASTIPLISAVGHETDTTLIDFVSDRRAPTPTAAAEMATPVLAELKASVADYEQRMLRCTSRGLEDRRNRLAAARLPSRNDLLGPATQRFDIAAQALGAALARNAAAHERDLVRIAGRFSPLLLQRPQRVQAERLASVAARLRPAVERALAQKGERLGRLSDIHKALSPRAPLSRGFALVHREDGSLARSANALQAAEPVTLEFEDGRRQAVVDGEKPRPQATPAKARPAPGQGDLF